MKALLTILVLLAANAWSATCDLRSNDLYVEQVNRDFDDGQMPGEEHLLKLRQALRERSEMIEKCLYNEQTENLNKEDLLQTKAHLNESLSIKIASFNEQIKIEIAHDRMGMAIEIMMDRDKEKLRVANLVALINKLISKLPNV